MSKIKEGDQVRFYDCWLADQERDYSGKNPKFWPVGTVIKRRMTERMYLPFSDIWLGGDNVVDIQLPDGRISKGHFTNGVKLINILNSKQ